MSCDYHTVIKIDETLPSGQNRQKKQFVGVYFTLTCILSAELTKTHFFRLFFWRFCPL